ncbi:hypothetical protein [Mesorhizobium sp.]|uniref:hypothetical protein n=1 Tax=Mesorhizobium sp. TaxID=1871066 RepID=UPI000FE98652|nr:hypothetical protein [Mesorhizobium sp.]RWD71623.1 MAG: hypothetical protein EOS37_10960 [Mesorhizobium sp.]
MNRLVCSPSLTLLQPPPDDRRRLGADIVRLLKLLSIFSREHPADLCARLLREEARRVLNLPVPNNPRAKRGPGMAGLLCLPSRGPPD